MAALSANDCPLFFDGARKDSPSTSSGWSGIGKRKIPIEGTPMLRTALILTVSLPLSGCIASTAVDVVTAPVRVGSQVADWATTSQDESDRALGRKTRQREENLGRLERRRSRLADDCEEGERDACREAEDIAEQIEELRVAPL
jgi:hypothetical protein